MIYVFSKCGSEIEVTLMKFTVVLRFDFDTNGFWANKVVVLLAVRGPVQRSASYMKYTCQITLFKGRDLYQTVSSKPGLTFY